MLALAWQYLTGRAVATDVADRRAPEWPPHPDRVFQALVDAWGCSGEGPAERAALEWLESLGPPCVAAPDGEAVVWDGARPTVYVPTNDAEGKSRGEYGDNQLRLLPKHRRLKARTFPCTVVGDTSCALIWPDADPAHHLAALGSLVSQVTRIGHSASLVRCWVADDPPAVTWVPADHRDAIDIHLRVPYAGRLRSLAEAFAGGAEGWQRPPMAPYVAYRVASDSSIPRGSNAGRMVIFRRVAGASLGLADALALANAVRRKLMRHATGDALGMISGHTAEGPPLREPHVSIAPLPFIGAPYADGHVLGVALVMPASAPYEREDAILRAVAASLDPETDTLTISAPRGRGSVSFAFDERTARPLALRPSTWTRSASTWATATPIVLDRMPPRRTRDRDAFVREEIARACERVDLPVPSEVGVGDVSPLAGVPHAASFPHLPTKDGLRRRHVHAIIRFERPVAGPLMLGAGRFRGLGLLRPLTDATSQQRADSTVPAREAP